MAHTTLRRFAGYDYSRGGSMFVTIALRERKAVFGHVDHEKVVLCPAGETVKNDFIEVSEYFRGFVSVRSVVVMPDHVHFRFTWPAGHADALKRIGQFVGRFKQLTQWHVAGRGAHLWQDGYHDILCVSERCNRSVDAYVENNPLKWWLMRCDRALMHVIEPFYLPEGVGGCDLWRAVGNFDLLSATRLVSLRISQRVPEAKLDEVVRACVRGALEKGYVYVSTFFSPGERRVFQALAAEPGTKMVRLMATYMNWAYRPHGAEPPLFAAKRFLALSRMPDPEAPPTRGELVGLNFVAADLARATGGKAVYVQWLGGRVVYGGHPTSPTPP